jgi:DNA-binding CsgD family transcriptional regulator
MATRLTHRQFDALQRTIVDLYALRRLDDLHAAFPQLVLQLIRADGFTLAEARYQPETRSVVALGVYESTPLLTTPELVQRMERTAAQHPFTRHVQRHGPGTALKLSDFMDRTQLERSELYNEYYRLIGIRHTMAVAGMAGDTVLAMNTYRGPRQRDFTEQERTLLQLLRPHFEQARRNAEVYERAANRDSRPLESFGLTRRESEVARWVAGGKTNGEIAIILGSSPRTVEKQVQRVLEKLGVENRTAAAVMISDSLTS